MAQLQTKIVYGLRTDIAGNAHFVNDEQIIYLIGNALSLHNFSQHHQRLLKLPDRKINFMTLAPNKKYLALCEAGEKPLISIYDIQKLKRRKLLGIPYEAPGVTQFSCVQFSCDSKYLVAVTGEPNQTMLFYNWEKGKVESSLEVSNTQNSASSVQCIACNPIDLGIMAIGGPYVFKFLTVSETVWRPYGFSKADNFVITSMSWINSDRLLATLLDGRIMYLENGELKGIFAVFDLRVMNLKIKGEYVQQSSDVSLLKDKMQEEITTILTFQNGFAVDSGLGKVVVFEKDGQNKYTKKGTFVIPKQISTKAQEGYYRINTISINSSNDKLLVTSGWAQLFYADFSDIDLNTEETEMSVLGDQLHNGRIGGISMCTWKSHFMTYGADDRSVRMWDSESEHLIMLKQYSEDVSCAILHPTGLFCLVGFSDKLRFMNIFIDDLEVMQEFSIRNCKTASFTNGGHLFAAVNGNIIQVHSSINFEKRYFLRGHAGVIKNLMWSIDDSKLVSVGADGAIYQWDVTTGERVSEVVIKGVTLNGIVISPDSSTIYCISTDCRIHEIKDESVTRVFPLSGFTPLKILRGKDESLMFLTYAGGALLSLSYPLKDPIQFNEYRILSADITELALTYNEHTLVTGATDGTLCFWKIVKTDTMALKIDLQIRSIQVLIDRDLIAERLQMIKDLNTRLKELETEHEYMMRQTAIQNNDKIRELHLGYSEAIEELRAKIDKLEEDHINEINEKNVEINKINTEHAEAMRQMEISYDSKLIVEYDKYSAFEEQNSQMVKDYERKLSELEKYRQDGLEKLTREFEARLHEKEMQLQEVHEEMLEQVRVHEELKLQIEDDADREIIELKTSYETKLFEERQTILTLKGEAGVLKNKHNTNLKEIEELVRQLNNLNREHKELGIKKVELDKHIEELKKEIAQQKLTINEKDKNINNLIQTNEELEKYKFVLNHRINELREQIKPRDDEIQELKTKINNMETELLGLNRFNVTLELKLKELREKLSSTKKEMQTISKQQKQYEDAFRKLRISVLEAADLIHEPNALKSHIIKLHQRYSNTLEFRRDYDAELQAQCEFKKQRNHMENTIVLLKKLISQRKADDNIQFEKTLEENVKLLNELQSLKQELISAQEKISVMETQMGLKKQDTSRQVEAKEKIARVSRENEQLELNFKKQMKECQRKVIVLKQDLERIISLFSQKPENSK